MRLKCRHYVPMDRSLSRATINKFCEMQFEFHRVGYFIIYNWPQPIPTFLNVHKLNIPPNPLPKIYLQYC